MSRHRFVKALDLDSELDAYDGDAAFDEEYDADAERQLREGTVKVKAIIGADFTDEEVRDSLWHYYYDVEKTVNYLLNQRATPQKKQNTSENIKGTFRQTLPYLSERSLCCHSMYQQSSPSNQTHSLDAWFEADAAILEGGGILNATRSPAPSSKDFFRDCPWLNVPHQRKAAISVEPLYPYYGLRGGASNTPKQSKLGALAAARRKKENDKADQPLASANSSVALLDKLTLKSKEGESSSSPLASPAFQAQRKDTVSQEPRQSQKPRKYLSRKRVDSLPTAKPSTGKQDVDKFPVQTEQPVPTAPILSHASAFGQILLGPASTMPPRAHEKSSQNYSIFPETFTESPFAGPSPDDIVKQAQSKSKGLKHSKATTKSTAKEKPMNGLSNELERTTITEASTPTPVPRVKSKNLDVVFEYQKAEGERKNAANFVVIGHVDAGKSTLMGRLLHDLRVVDKRTLDKYQRDASKIGKSSFAFAWVMDEGSEERERGVTIDIASSKFETKSTIFTVLDAPGHQDFVPNMIAGASRADFAVLVLDASGSHFETGLQGQSKEHALLVRSLGVQRLVVAINKLDTISWSHKRFDEISQQTSAFLAAAGFQSTNIAFVPCSGLHGENVITRSKVSELSWYQGPSLLEELEAAASPRTYPLRGPLRMSIADIITGGTVYPLSVSGRISSGTLQLGDSLVVIPGNATGYIRALEVDSEQTDFAVAGQNTTLHISEMDAALIRPGDVVCSPQNPIQAKTTFSLKALAFSHLTPMFISIIVSRTNVQGRISKFTALLDKTTGQVVKKRPRLVKPGEVARLELSVEAEGGLPVEGGARIILRAAGETVATGIVE